MLQRNDDFRTLLAESAMARRHARRNRLALTLRDFCALAAVSGFVMAVAVWSDALSPQRPTFGSEPVMVAGDAR